MKIDTISDLHINHHIPFNSNQEKWKKKTQEWTEKLMQTGNGELLLIGGDFSEWNAQSIWFLEEAARHTKKVLFVIGNHDYYLLSKKQNKKYGTSKNRLQDFLDAAAGIPGVTPLQRSIVNIDGLTIAGDSLWYLPETQSDWEFFHTISNDSNYIHLENPWKETPTVLYEEAMSWYHKLEHESIDIMLSHVPPVHPSISPFPYNSSCYVCPVPFLVGKHWIAGHQHIQGDFEKAGVQFHMNALGYPEQKKKFSLHSFIV